MTNNPIKIIQILTLFELPLNQTISIDIINSQYKKLAKIYHPDVANSRYKDGIKFKELKAAQEYLLANINYVNQIIITGFSLSNSNSSSSQNFYNEQQKKQEEERRRQEELRKKQEKLRRQEELRKKQEKLRRQEELRKQEERLRSIREKKLEKKQSRIKKYNLIKNFIQLKSKQIIIFTSIFIAIIFAVIIERELSKSINFFDENNDLLLSYYRYKGQEIDTPDDLFKEGYEIEWYNNSEFVGFPLILPLKVNNDLNLYPKYIPKKYLVKFETNGGSYISPIFDDYDKKIEINIPYKNGHTFLGWYSDENFTKPFDLENIPLGGVTLYAKYSKNKYLISFETFGGTSIQSIIKLYGEIIDDKIIPIKSGYYFEGWYFDEELSEKVNNETMPANHVQLYAKWTPIEYEIKFILNNGENNLSEIREFNANIEFPLIYNQGYYLDGWYRDVHFTEKVDEISKVPLNGAIYYAKWLKNIVSLSFDSNGGSSISPITKEYLDPILPPNKPTKQGYTFEGWYINNNFDKEFIFDFMPHSNLKLFAKWKINEYTLSFDSNGGSIVSSITKNYMENVSLETPVLDGFSFEGWYEDSAFNIKFNTNFMPHYDTTLFAKWEPNIYMIIFESNGGSLVEPVTKTYLSDINEPIQPNKEGHSFVNWYSNKELTDIYKFDIMPLNGIKLYAKWEKNQYTIHFDTNNGTEIQSITEYYEQNIYEPNIPSRGNFKFGGWYLDKFFTQEFIFDKMGSSNITLYARWDYRVYNHTQLIYLRGNSNLYVTLMSDIDLSNYYQDNWESLGDFSGVFDGNGFKLKNRYNNKNGLFRYINSDGLIKNLTVELNSSNTSALAVRNYGSIVNSKFESYIFGGNSASIVTYNYGLIENCINYGVVETYLRYNDTPKHPSGIVNTNYGTLKNCINYGKIYSYQNDRRFSSPIVSGIVNTNYGTIDNCSNFGVLSYYYIDKTYKSEYCYDIVYENNGNII